MEDTASKTPKGTDLALTFTPELKQVASNVAREFIVMTSVNAPEYKADSRAPIDLVGVIDRSGSMDGERLDLVKETMKFVVENLQADDRLGIVTYDDTVENHLALTKMDKEGKEVAFNSIQAIFSGGSTNLCGGLVGGVNQMRERKTKNEVSSVLLFTDGQANVGYVSAPDIIRATVDSKFADSLPGSSYDDVFGNSMPMYQQQQFQQMPYQQYQQQQIPYQATPPPSKGFFSSVRNIFSGSPARSSAPAPQPIPPQPIISQAPQQQQSIPEQELPSQKSVQEPLPCTINAFGFGTDHNAELLKKIADHGSGAYYYIEKKDNISEAFADCLGGLLSTVGQDLILSYEALGDVSIKKLHSKFAVTEIKPNKSYSIAIGDIQSEEEKDILISLALPQSDAALDSSEILKVTLKYTNVITKQEISTEVIATIKRPASPEKETRNYAVDKQLNRVIAAEAMETSNELAKEGKMKGARDALDAAMGRIKESVSGGDAFSQSLVKDLERCKEGLKSEAEYNAVGSKMLMNQAQAHMKQRSTNVQWESQACYQTSNRQQMYSNFKSK